MRPSAGLDPDEHPVSFRGRSAPAGIDLREVSIPAHSHLVYEPAAWAGALVVVEAGEIELEGCDGTSACFPAGSVLCFDGLALRAIRNTGGETVLLSAASRHKALEQPLAGGPGDYDGGDSPRVLRTR